MAGIALASRHRVGDSDRSISRAAILDSGSPPVREYETTQMVQYYSLTKPALRVGAITDKESSPGSDLVVPALVVRQRFLRPDPSDPIRTVPTLPHLSSSCMYHATRIETKWWLPESSQLFSDLTYARTTDSPYHVASCRCGALPVYLKEYGTIDSTLTVPVRHASA